MPIDPHLTRAVPQDWLRLFLVAAGLGVAWVMGVWVGGFNGSIGVFQLRDRRLQRPLLAVPHDLHIPRVAHRRLGNCSRQMGQIRHTRRTERQDQVADLKPGFSHDVRTLFIQKEVPS